MAERHFDIRAFTQAPLQIEATIGFEGKTAEEVFDIMGNPAAIPDWYLLAKRVKIHPPKDDDEEQSFNVEFTFFGDVYEEVLHWDPPHRYVYLARGEGFPIADYVALIKVSRTNDARGLMRWQIFFSQIRGKHFARLLPVILPPITEASIDKLAQLVGGVQHEVRSFMDEEKLEILEP